jgi:hypothetical protein
MTAETIKKNNLNKKTTSKTAIATTAMRAAMREPTPRQVAIIAAASQHPDLSERKIAAITSTDPAQVHRTLKAFGITTKLTDDYINYRAKIYQGLQAKIISSISAQDIAKAGLRDKCVAVGIIHDHERIELGQSTDKQPVLVLVRGDHCQVSVGGKVEGDQAQSAGEAEIVDIIQDNKALHQLSG